MSDIYLSVDAGNSDTKVEYRTPLDSVARYFLMSSAVEKVTKLKLKDYRERKGWLGSPAPEKQAWLEWNEQVFLVGALAHEFDPSDRRVEPKYESAVYKVLAAIGVIVQKHQLATTKKLKVRLGVLLPCNEYSDRHRFQKSLELMSSNYQFRGQTIKVKLEEVACRPEGGGLAIARMRLNGEEWFSRQRLGVWMLGDRNFTGLYFESGELKVSDSPLIGFSFMLDRIIERTSGLTRASLTEAIFQGLQEAQKTYPEDSSFPSRPPWEELEAIKALATARDPNLRSLEVKDIASAIESVASEWDEKIQKWLKRIFPKRLTEISVCGGPLPFFAPTIEQYFNCSMFSEQARPLNSFEPFVPIRVGAGIVEKIKEVFQLHTEEANEMALPFRLVDGYIVLDYLITSSEEENDCQRTA
jgi:Actin like proteins N terminal domain